MNLVQDLRKVVLPGLAIMIVGGLWTLAAYKAELDRGLPYFGPEPRIWQDPRDTRTAEIPGPRYWAAESPDEPLRTYPL
ncbi:hypothetical protein [Fontivita pretiosa]|uniref:hypothetical protein n=1 Tax=Fontivita pretiosa TaxID=2989684 RepID=UPI003D1712EF